MVDENKVDGAELENVEKVADQSAPETPEVEEKQPVPEQANDSASVESAKKEVAEVEKDSEDAVEADAVASAPRSSKHSKYGVISGIVHVMATFNNTKVTITDKKGNVIAWRSGGRCGFKGSRKSTAYAATIVAQEAAREAVSKGLREAEIHLNGPGAGRESAARAIHAARIKVTSIQDVTPIPHNGCRPPKRRRV